MQKTKSSILNAISMVFNTLIISVLGLVSTNIIIKNYGSDINGVVATANQIVTLLLILEGGFTIAINVALYKPFVKKNIKLINKILSTAKRVFLKIGILFFVFGVIISVIYPVFIKSDLDYFTIFLIFLMVIVGSAYNLIFTIRYQIMFQVAQKEYIYTLLSIIINILSSLTTIVLAYCKVDILFIRLSVLSYILINGFLIYLLFKKYFSYVNLISFSDLSLISGTKDLVIQKLTSVIYLSFPLLFISTFVSTKMSSVYVVYNSIYNIIRNVLNSIISAPVNAFGQLLSNNENKKAFVKFELYEYIVILSTSILISITLCLIIPFVTLYTSNINEINYVNLPIAIMLSIIVFLELIHIPSGHIINVTGKFKISKNINLIISFVLFLLLIIFGINYGIYGILLAIILSNVLLSILEISYTHCKIFNSNLKKITLLLIVNVICVVILQIIFEKFNLVFYNYLDFVKYGILVTFFNAFFILFINFFFFGKMFKELFMIIKNVLFKKLIKE